MGSNSKSFNRQKFKLILAGNKNIPTMVNAVIQATLQLRVNIKNDSDPEGRTSFSQVHIFHTEESLQALMSDDSDWKEALNSHGVETTSLVHHVTKVEDSSEDRFDELVDQLKTIVNPIDNAYYYIDLTGGLSSLKSILAVFAYVLDIDNIYSLEIDFSREDREDRNRQSRLFYDQLIEENVPMRYRKFPSISKFDDFGKLNYTEVIRYRRLINILSQELSSLVPDNLDVEHMSSSLLSGINSRLIGEVNGDVYGYRHSIFSSAAGIEEITSILLSIFQDSRYENKTLGPKMDELINYANKSPKYFIDPNTLGNLKTLLVDLRNEVSHPKEVSKRSSDLLKTKALLASQITIAFLNFSIKALSSFVDSKGQFVDINMLDGSTLPEDDEFYFGFDGDLTGDYLEVAFSSEQQDEQEIVRRSETLRASIKQIRKEIGKRTRNHKAVIFAEGDDILFKSRYDQLLLLEIQRIYKRNTKLSSSIGYGKTLNEAAIALRLAKSRIGDSIVGVVLTEGTVSKNPGML